MESNVRIPSTLRVLHLASWYPSAVHGTLGNFVRRHIDAISTQFPSEVWAAAAAPKGSKLPTDTVESTGDLTERLVYFRAKKPVVRQTTRALLELARQHAGAPFDLIHLHVAYPAGQAARQLAMRWNIPLVVTEHWTAYHADQRHKLPLWRKRSMRLTGQASTLLCPVSEDLALSMLNFGMKSPFHVVPNVVNTDLFHLNQSESVPTESFELLHVSSLSDEQKNISGILRALVQALSQCPNLRVTIVGDGDPLPHQKLAKRLGIANRVHVQGEISLPEVAQRMRSANALLLFSNFENFPCVIPEAWASGIPVISTDVGGISEHLTSDRGILVQRGDEDALAAAIRSLATNPPSTLLDRAGLRAVATSTFSIEAIANQYALAYEKALRMYSASKKRVP